MLTIEAYRDGTAPEGIVEMYSSLQLADVYGASLVFVAQKRDILLTCFAE
jgi:hypothetical protein